ncbi:hypothetical protein FJZ33_08145 [Candidatus Poribacteria bacterium]|nr:hypothetical protein [Candidatus Poribacteria bacterium]
MFKNGKLSFESMDYGEYLALPIKDSIYYAVFLYFGATNADEKLIQRVFPNYDQKAPNAKLLKPAMFEPDASRTVWELKEKGEFDLPPSLEMVTSLYNDGVNDSDKQNEFIQRYKPIIICATNSGGIPSFQAMDSGDYYAVAISDGYAVLPRFDIELNETTYGPGALGYTFEIHNYDGKTKYRGMKVLAPATFETDLSRQNWKLKDKGGLELGEIVKVPIAEEVSEPNKAIQDIVDKYNAINNSDERLNFIKQYKCIYLSYDKKKNVLYAEEKDSIGDYTTSYYATAVENSSYYIVLPKFLTPKFEMIINTFDYDRLIPLFDFPCYKPKGKPYRNAKLAKPAKIRERPDREGNSVWEIIEKGELDLGEKGTDDNQEAADKGQSSFRLGAMDLMQELDKIKILYNEAVDDSSKKRDDFKGKSKKNVDLYITTEKKSVWEVWKRDKPTFKEVQGSDFSYYAVEIPGDSRYALVPRFGLEINKNKYESSIKDTFSCPDFDPKMKYSDVKVTRPATSEYDPEKKIWTLTDKGELKLGQGKR